MMADKDGAKADLEGDLQQHKDTLKSTKKDFAATLKYIPRGGRSPAMLPQVFCIQFVAAWSRLSQLWLRFRSSRCLDSVPRS